MSDTHEKGSFQADIPSDAVEEALRSVERVAGGAAEVPAEPVAIEAEAASEPSPSPSPSEVELASLRAQLELSQAKARETLEKLREEHERVLRTTADLENYKKRAAKEREEVQKFGVERLVKDLLPVIDNLDRALAAAPGDGPLTAGVRLVRASFEQALARHAVKAFSAMGERFDPARHEALLQVATADQPPGTVVLEHGRGFTLNDRLLRPAMVGVAVAPPAAEGSEDASAGGP